MAGKQEERNGKLERVGDIFPEMLKGLNLGSKFRQQMVLHQWDKIVGKDIAAHARPAKLEYKRLFIRTTHPAWAEQLKYMERALKAKINAYAGERVVQELVFTNILKEQPMASAEASLVQKPQVDVGKELKKIRLPDQELAAMHSRCRQMANQELAVQMERLGQNVRKMDIYHRSIGWHQCGQEGCMSLCPPEDEFCQGCMRERKHAKARKIRRLLYDMPWSSYMDIAQEVECTPEEYTEQRTILMQNIAQRVFFGDLHSTDAMTLVMLYRSIPPEQLNEQVMKKTLYRLRYDLQYAPLKKDKKEKQEAKSGREERES